MTRMRKLTAWMLALVMSIGMCMLFFGAHMYRGCGVGVLIWAAVISVVISLLIHWLQFKDKWNMYSQIMIVSLFGGAPVVTSVLFNAEAFIFASYVMPLFMYLLIYIPAYMVVAKLAEMIINNTVKDKCYGFKESILTHKWIILVLMLVIAVRLPYVEMLQRFDAGEYYFRFSKAVGEFQYSSLSEYFHRFILCRHSTLGFSFVYLIGEVIFPKKIIGVSIVSIVFTVIALWCAYKVLLKVINGLSYGKAAVYTLIISMAPLVFSTTTYFNTDYIIAMFFMIALYGCVCNKPVIAGVASMLCFQTKETGLVLIGALVLGILTKHLMENGLKGCVKNVLRDGRLYGICMACIAQLVYMVNIGGISTWKNTNSKPLFDVSGTAGHSLGYDSVFIIKKTQQQFVLNFNWIMLVIIVFCILALRRYCKRENTKAAGDFFKKNVLIMLPFVTYYIFHIFYITGSHARYNVVSDMLLYMIAFHILEFTKGKGLLCFKRPIYDKFAAVSLLALLSVQCFYTIDPLTRLCFKTLDAGGVTMCNVNRIEYYTSIQYSEGLVYNTQYQYIDRAYDKLLREIDYEPGKLDVFALSGNGCFATGNEFLYKLNWDTQRRRRVFYENENTQPMESLLVVPWISKGETDLPVLKKQAVAIYNPYWLDVNLDAEFMVLSQWYDIGEPKTVKTAQGNIIYYMLELKE